MKNTIIWKSVWDIKWNIFYGKEKWTVLTFMHVICIYFVIMHTCRYVQWDVTTFVHISNTLWNVHFKGKADGTSNARKGTFTIGQVLYGDNHGLQKTSTISQF